MDVAATISSARAAKGLTQTRLAKRAGTSQATISAYESGAKTPSIATLERLLLATGARLELGPAPGEDCMRDDRLAATERELREVLALAALLPVEHADALTYPRLPGGA